MFRRLFVFVCFTTTLLLQVVQSRKKAEDWDHHVILGGNDMQHSGSEPSDYNSELPMYHVYWTAGDKEITFKLEVATKGWVGFGLSPTGGIAKSDIIISWVDGDKAYLYDYYAKDDSTLNIDEQQDWKLLSGTENKTHTVLVFSRVLETCDMKDIAVTNDSQHLIYTQYPSDPMSPTSVNFRQTVWMTQYVKLLQPRIEESPMPETVLHWDIRAQNFTIPAKNKTFYFCQMFRSPTVKRKHHVIKVTAVIRPQNWEMVHHASILLCFPRSIKEAEQAVAFGPTECYQENMPRMFERCNFYVGWGRGGGSLIYPMHAGLPFEGTMYFNLEIHYDNPTFRTGIVDDSGLRIYYTPKLRPNDADSFSLGTSSLGTFITNVFPPGQRDFISSAHGHPLCLAQGMPKDGINVFALVLHAHLLVTKMKLRHFRKNKELPPIAMDVNYNTHYQEYIYFPRDVKVLPGDQLTLECNQDTRGRVVATMNGLGTEEEMCVTFIFFYPPISTTLLDSYPKLELVAGLTGMNITERDYLTLPQIGIANEEYTDFLQDYDWPESQRCIFQNALRYSPQESLCYLDNFEMVQVPMTTYPENLKPYRFPNQCKGKIRRDRDLRSRCD